MAWAIVVMGVAGCGKSTLAEALAHELGLAFIEGDSLHPPANIAKMAGGRALDDDDRLPFLRNVADALKANAEPGAVASCSALRRGYRDLIRDRANVPVRFVHVAVPREELARRLARRTSHFMPAALLDSQLATLEAPLPAEDAITVDGCLPTAEQVREALAALAR